MFRRRVRTLVLLSLPYFQGGDKRDKEKKELNDRAAKHNPTITKSEVRNFEDANNERSEFLDEATSNLHL